MNVVSEKNPTRNKLLDSKSQNAQSSVGAQGPRR